MMSLTEMVSMVRLCFLQVGYDKLEGNYINRSRNYFLTVDRRQHFVLKWDLNEWLTAGSEVPEIGKGPGRAVSLDVWMEIIKPSKATTLFGYNKNNTIKSITYEEFERLGENHQQRFNDEWVRVVSSKELKDWKL